MKCFASSPASWVTFTSYWFSHWLDASPLEVFSRPFSFGPWILPPSINLFCLLGGPSMVPSLSLAIPWFLVLLSVTFVFLSLACPPNCVTSTCCPRAWSYRIVWRSLRLLLGLFTGQLPGALSTFVIWTVRSLTLTGRSPMAFSTPRSVLCL